MCGEKIRWKKCPEKWEVASWVLVSNAPNGPSAQQSSGAFGEAAAPLQEVPSLQLLCVSIAPKWPISCPGCVFSAFYHPCCSYLLAPAPIRHPRRAQRKPSCSKTDWRPSAWLKIYERPPSPPPPSHIDTHTFLHSMGFPEELQGSGFGGNMATIKMDAASLSFWQKISVAPPLILLMRLTSLSLH